MVSKCAFCLYGFYYFNYVNLFNPRKVTIASLSLTLSLHPLFEMILINLTCNLWTKLKDIFIEIQFQHATKFYFYTQAKCRNVIRIGKKMTFFSTILFLSLVKLDR